MKRKCRFNFSTKRALQVTGVFSAVFLFLGVNGCGEQSTADTAENSGDSSLVYYCPMHPHVEQYTPGQCPEPECHGMELLLKNPDNYLDLVLRPVSGNVLSKVSMSSPVYAKFPVFTEATGYIDYDNYGSYDISSRYSGRIEKLYVKYNYQPVKKGEVLFEIYSPDLVVAQENLLYLLKSSPNDSSLIAAARQKLILLQLTESQIEEIERSGKSKQVLPIYCKYDGNIREVVTSGMDNGSMNSSYQVTSELSVKEGMYVERGQVLFKVVNPDMLVVMLQIKSTDMGKVWKGQPVRYQLTNDTSLNFNGTVDFVEPVFNTNAKTMMVRVNIDNPSRALKAGELVNAMIISDSLETLWVPESTVVDLGQRKIVWVWNDGYFKARLVETGIRSSGMIEIADGITEADQIAEEAHFLSDSENFVTVSNDDE